MRNSEYQQESQLSFAKVSVLQTHILNKQMYKYIMNYQDLPSCVFLG